MTPGTRVYRFGAFRLDVAGHSLQRNGQPLSVPPKAFQLLVLLIERSGALITKEELLDTLWPDVIVQENNLTQQISLLRKLLPKVLDDEGEWIETIPRVGYRFAGAVTIEAEPDPTVAAAPAAIPQADEERESPRWYLRTTAAVLAIVVTMATVFVLAKRHLVAEEPAKSVRSLAVLPLRPLAANTALDHLGAGIADAVTHHLASLDSLEVRPSSVVLRYAGKERDLARIARELNVDAIVTGTIHRSNGRIRIRMQLVDVKRNVAIFSGQFDEPEVDLFSIEDLVAGAVARALALDAPARGGQAARRRSRVPGAYEAYLKGRFEWSKRSPAGLTASISHYERAIELDPRYAAAYAALGDAYNLLPMHRVALPEDAFPRAKRAAEAALALDPELADAHVVLGTAAFYYDWDWATAERHLRTAIALDANYSTARHILSNLFVATARFDEAFAMMEEARRRDPMSVTLDSVGAYQYYLGRRYREAVEQARRTLDRDSNYVQAHSVLGRSLVAIGSPKEGLAEMDRFIAMLGDDSYALAQRASAYASVPQRRGEALAMRPALLELLATQKLSPFDLVRYHAALGETDEAVRRLEEARAIRDPGLVWVGVDPELDELREDSRFQKIVREMQFPDVPMS